MQPVTNSCVVAPSAFNKAIVAVTSILAVTGIALGIIGLTPISSGTFNAIAQLGTISNGILLGTSIFALILDFVLVGALCKKTKDPFISQSEPSRIRSAELECQTPGPFKHESPQSAPISAVEAINDTDSLSQLPEEIILRVFSSLNVIQLTKCGEVSRRWGRLASDTNLWNAFDLRKLYPSLNVFDESDWTSHVDLSSFSLSVEDAPPLNKRQVILLMERKVTSQPIEGNSGVTLMTIPKGLTFNKLVQLAKVPKMGNVTQFRFYEDISRRFGDFPVDKTYRLLITNNVFRNNQKLLRNFFRKMPRIDPKKNIEKIGFEIPKLLEITALFVITNMKSGKLLYAGKSQYKINYAICAEEDGGTIAWSIDESGISSISLLEDYRNPSRIIRVGGVLREF